MTDIHDMRAQMREGRGSRPVVAQGGGGLKIPFGIIAGAAVVLGFVVVLLTPKIYSVQRTAALPVFKEARQEPGPAGPPAAVAPAAEAPAARSAYAGKSPEDAGRMADAVCEHRMASAPQRGQAAVEAKLH